MKGFNEITETDFDSLMPMDPFEAPSVVADSKEDVTEAVKQEAETAKAEASATEPAKAEQAKVATDTTTVQKPVTDDKYLDIETSKGKLVKVTQFGKDVELPLEEVIKGYNEESAAQAKFQDVARREQRLASVLESIKKGNPLEVLIRGKHISDADAEKAAQEFLGQRVLEKLMPEDKRKALQQEREIAQLKAKLQERDAHDHDTWLEKHNPDIGEALKEAFKSPDIKIPINKKVSDMIGEEYNAALKQDPNLYAELRKDAKGTSAKILAAALPLVQEKYMKEVGVLLGTDDQETILAAINRQTKQQPAPVQAQEQKKDKIPDVKTESARKRTRTAKMRAETANERARSLVADAMKYGIG